MRALNCLMLAGSLVFALFVTVAADNDAPSNEPDVTIRQKGGKTIQEYHVNSFFYAIKVVPKHGKPYFLVRAGGSGSNFTHSDQPDKLIPQWGILSW